MAFWVRILLSILHPLGYERVDLPLVKVADTPFHIRGDDIHVHVCAPEIGTVTVY